MPKTVTKTQSITLAEIQALMRLQKSYSDLKRQFQIAEAAVVEAEQVVLDKLDHGTATPAGFDLTVKKMVRRYPAWKDWFIRLIPNGKVEAERILAKTKPTVTRSVEVRELSMRKAA